MATRPFQLHGILRLTRLTERLDIVYHEARQPIVETLEQVSIDVQARCDQLMPHNSWISWLSIPSEGRVLAQTRGPVARRTPNLSSSPFPASSTQMHLRRKVLARAAATLNCHTSGASGWEGDWEFGDHDTLGSPSRMVRARSLDDAKREASKCTRCTSVSNVSWIPLVKGRTQVVYGVGPPNAVLMVIGEAPGKDEDEKGEPFIGKGASQAGKILDEWLDEIGAPRGEIYITNIVMCRPTKVVKGSPPSNRHPGSHEIEACAPWLEEQVRLVNPKLIVPLGVPATSAILSEKVLMREVHGEERLGREGVWKGRTIIPTFHPAGIRGNTQRMLAFRKDFETIRDVYRRLRA